MNELPQTFDYVFQSTLSMRRATLPCVDQIVTTLFQSTLSMRRATIEGVEARETHDISIHALHEESDVHDSDS